MSILLNLFEELVKGLPTVLLALRYVARHEGFILMTRFLWRAVKKSLTSNKDFSSLKTVTFGDEATVSSDFFFASIVSVVMIFVSWGLLLVARFATLTPNAFSVRRRGGIYLNR